MWVPVNKSGETDVVKAIIREIMAKKENVECYVNIKQRDQTVQQHMIKVIANIEIKKF